VRTSFWLLMALLALVPAGCQLAEDEQPDDPRLRKPLKVQHAMGERRVPFLAERPVTIDPSALEAALALGVTPAGSTSWLPGGRFPSYIPAREVEPVERLGSPEEVDPAAVAALRPDVVIGNQAYQEDVHSELDEFVPTVMSGVPISEWKSDLRFFGESLGRGNGAERLLLDYDRRAALAREALSHSRGARVSVPRSLTDQLDPDFVDDVLEDAGLRPGAVEGGGQGGGILAAHALLAAIERSAESRQ
jgi:ABC-type Fe3+-hydroxamate transport system substrate-binding protein